MNPVLYPAGETEFTNNGLGRLTDAITCTVTEERNGQYELELTYPTTGLHYADICEERIIAATHDDTGDIQPFRIYRISRPMDGKVTVFARHLSYQLSKVVVMPFSTAGCSAALQGLKSNAVGDCPFSFWTDKVLTNPYAVETPATLRSLLGGTEGSILDVFGPGEFEWDRFTVRFHTHRGSDTGVVLRYGRDLTDIKKTTTTESVWTGIVPFWKGSDGENEIVVTLPEKVLYGDFTDDYVFRMVVPVDFSASFPAPPTEAQLRGRAQSYVAANADTGIPATIDVSFVALWQTEEYKNVAPMQHLRLCDTVSVVHRALGVENRAKIVSVTYNVLLDRYDKMTVGEIRVNLTDTIRIISGDMQKEAPTLTDMQRIVSHATNLSTGGLGGHVVIGTNADGQPNEILILDTEDISTAIKILRIDQNGIGFSSSGYGGPYRTAWTLDGHLSANFMDQGAIKTVLLKTGLIRDANGNTLIDLDSGIINLNGQATAGNKVQFTAAGKLIAVDGEFSGEIHSDDGEIGGFSIGSGALISGSPVTIPASLNDDVNVYLGEKGVSVDSKSDSAIANRLGIALEDGKLIIYQNSAAIASFAASESSPTNQSANCPAELLVDLNARGDTRENGTDEWRRFFRGNGSINELNCYEITENLASSDGTVIGQHSIHGDLVVYNDFDCRGTKSRVIPTNDFGERKLYCYETASPLFGDVGEGVLSSNGICVIDLDPVFEETVKSGQYQVFLQVYGNGIAYIGERGPHSFTVLGTPLLAFGWEIKAKQKDFSQLRLEVHPNCSEQTGIAAAPQAAERGAL